MSENGKITENLPPEVGFNRLGWKAPRPDLDFESWETSMSAIVAAATAAPWAIGDGFIYAQERGGAFEDQALNSSVFKGYAKQTIYNCAVMARLYPPTMRRMALTMKHHQMVAKLARTDMAAAQYLLEKAEEHEMSATEVLAIALGSHATASETPETPNDATSEPEAATGRDWRESMLADALKTFGYIECSCHEQQSHASNDHCAQTLAREWIERYETAKAEHAGSTGSATTSKAPE